MNTLALAALALLIETFVGYPAALQNLIGHPVQWIGSLITYLDEGLNDGEAAASQNRTNGVIAVVFILAASILPAVIVTYLLAKLHFGWVINIALATSLLAQKSLTEHVSDVANALSQGLDDARQTVAQIVGRDPTQLDKGGIAKAALESLAENTSDGVVAPFLFYAVAGLPGLVAYKAINTADSMIGHKSEKYLNFGWAAARVDDLLNLIPARVTGLLFIAAARANNKTAMLGAWSAMWRDAPKQASPNAGWPEAAMAGALGFSFGGPRSYDGTLVDLPTMGNGNQPKDEMDIAAGLTLQRNAMALLLLLSAGLAIAL